MCVGKLAGFAQSGSDGGPAALACMICALSRGLRETCKIGLERLTSFCLAGCHIQQDFESLCERHEWLAQLTCQQNLGRPNAMYGNGAAWPPQAVEPAESLCKACNVSRYTFEPPSIFCTSCQQRIKRNQVRHLGPACLLIP